MKILLKKFNDRYGFNVLTDRGKTIYSSFIHYFLTPHIKSSYKYAWEACRDAWKMSKNNSYHLSSRMDLEKPVIIDVSAEQMLINHYVTVFNNLRVKAKGANEVEKKEREHIYKEIRMVLDELNMIVDQITEPKDKIKIKKIVRQYQVLIDKYFKSEKQKELRDANNVKLASSIQYNLISDPVFIDDILDDYAQKICKAIQNKHNDIYYKINLDDKEILIYNFNDKIILKVKANANLIVESIIPYGDFYKLYPLHSVCFYQKYWKPIVEAIGMICVNQSSLVIKTQGINILPDVPRENEDYCIDAYDYKNKTNKKVNISFVGEEPIWMIKECCEVKTAQSKNISKYTEQDYLNAIVKCIDPNLKSLHNRSGVVIQVIPLEDFIEIDVDFGRGLDIVRLTEKQVEIVKV